MLQSCVTLINNMYITICLKGKSLTRTVTAGKQNPSFVETYYRPGCISLARNFQQLKLRFGSSLSLLLVRMWFGCAEGLQKFRQLEHVISALGTCPKHTISHHANKKAANLGYRQVKISKDTYVIAVSPTYRLAPP
jgi:hypothetical protein